MSTSKVKQVSLVLTILAVLVATFMGFTRQSARAAAICSPATAASVPFTKDGVGDVCVQTTSLCTYINSWNTTAIEVNGTSYTNLYAAASSIPAVNGTYTIHYVSTVGWGHFEMGGACASGPTSTSAPATNTTVAPTLTRTNTVAVPTNTAVGPTATSVPATSTTAPATSTPTSGGTLKVQMVAGGTDNTQQTAFNLLVVNTGSSAATNISARIYFTTENSNAASSYVLEKYYDQSGVSTVSGPTLASGSTYYYTVNFGTASLPAGGTWAYNTGMHLSSWASTYSATNDFWHGTGTLPASFTNWSSVPLYVNGSLVWGSEPGGVVSPTNTAVGPTATRTNTQIAPTVTRTSTVTPTGGLPTAGPTATTAGPTATTVVPTNTPSGPTPTPGGHLANPFIGANFYINRDWRGSTTFPTTNTFLWMDSIAAVNGTGAYARSLAGHLDLALAQGANAVSLVIYDLPNRDCSALSSNGELLQANNGTARYRTEYIDNIYNILSQPKYAGLRFIAVIEPDSLPNLITNTSFPKCQEATSPTDGYVVNTQYTLNKFYTLRNFYSYIDIGHAGWLGWPANFTPFVTLVSNMVKGTTHGVNSIDGFVDGTANTQVETETFLDAATIVGGNPVRSGSYFDWNDYIDESHYSAALKTAFQAAGLPASSTNFILDTSRNGWGGCGGGPYALQTCRPTKTSTSTVLDTYINESRIDRRPAKGNWCNQNGAGIGKMPGAGTAPYQWYVWVKPPGESDGSSTLIPVGPLNPDGKGLDGMCDPTYMGNLLNENMNSNALPNAPLSGAWFQAQFDQLVANKYP